MWKGFSTLVCTMSVRSHNPQSVAGRMRCPHEFGGSPLLGDRVPLYPWQQAALHTLGRSGEAPAQPAPALQTLPHPLGPPG